MAINGRSVQYNGGFLPGMTVDPTMLLPPSGNPIKCHDEVLSLQAISHLINVSTFIPPPLNDDSLDAFIFFFEQ